MQKPTPGADCVRRRGACSDITRSSWLTRCASVRAARLPGDPRQIAEEIVQNVYASLLARKLSTAIQSPDRLPEDRRCAVSSWKYRERQMKDQIVARTAWRCAWWSIRDGRVPIRRTFWHRGCWSGRCPAVAIRGTANHQDVGTDGMKPQKSRMRLDIPVLRWRRPSGSFASRSTTELHGRVRKSAPHEISAARGRAGQGGGGPDPGRAPEIPR